MSSNSEFFRIMTTVASVTFGAPISPESAPLRIELSPKQLEIVATVLDADALRGFAVVLQRAVVDAHPAGVRLVVPHWERDWFHKIVDPTGAPLFNISASRRAVAKLERHGLMVSEFQTDAKGRRLVTAPRIGVVGHPVLGSFTASDPIRSVEVTVSPAVTLPVSPAHPQHAPASTKPRLHAIAADAPTRVHDVRADAPVQLHDMFADATQARMQASAADMPSPQTPPAHTTDGVFVQVSGESVPSEPVHVSRTDLHPLKDEGKERKPSLPFNDEGKVVVARVGALFGSELVLSALGEDPGATIAAVFAPAKQVHAFALLQPNTSMPHDYVARLIATCVTSPAPVAVEPVIAILASAGVSLSAPPAPEQVVGGFVMMLCAAGDRTNAPTSAPGWMAGFIRSGTSLETGTIRAVLDVCGLLPPAQAVQNPVTAPFHEFLTPTASVDDQYTLLASAVAGTEWDDPDQIDILLKNPGLAARVLADVEKVDHDPAADYLSGQQEREHGS